MRRTLSALLVVLAAGTVSPGFAQLLQIRGNYWKPDLGGTIRVDRFPFEGTEVDIGDTLGLDSANSFGLAGALRLGRWNRIEVALQQFDVTCSELLEDTILFEGITFPVNRRIESELTLTRIRGTIELSPLAYVPSMDGGVYFGAEYIRAEASVEAEDLGKASGSIDTVLPLIGGRLRGYLLLGFYVEGIAEFSKFEIGSVDVDYQRLRGAVGYELTYFFGAEAGYDWLSLSGGSHGVSADVTFDGPYLAAFVQF